MWPYKCMGKNTKNGFTELVASNLSVCKPVLKSTTSLIAMLHIVKVRKPRRTSFDRFPGKLQCQATLSAGKGVIFMGISSHNVKVIILWSDE